MRELVIAEIKEFWSKGYCCMMNIGHEMGWPSINQDEDDCYRVQTPSRIVLLEPFDTHNVELLAEMLTDSVLLTWLRNCHCECYR